MRPCPRGAQLSLACLSLLLGCGGPQVVRLDPLPDGAPLLPERTDGGLPVLTVREGHLVGMEGGWMQIPPSGSRFLVHHDGGGRDVQGEQPRAALWVRGAGGRRHLLPQSVSPVLNLDTSEEWPLVLDPGTYELSVTLAGPEVGALGEPLVLVVR